MSWKKRARVAVEKSAGQQKQETVEEVAAEAQTIASDLQVLLESAGASAVGPLSLDEDGLKLAEKAYRSLGATFRSSEDNDQIERLLAIFLGRVLIERNGGQWAFYQGKYNTLSPVVVKLPSGRNVDVFGLSRGLYLDGRVRGARSGEALVGFLESAEELGVP